MLGDLPDGSAVEASWRLDHEQRFYLAAVGVYAVDQNWVEAGVGPADDDMR